LPLVGPTRFIVKFNGTEFCSPAAAAVLEPQVEMVIVRSTKLEKIKPQVRDVQQPDAFWRGGKTITQKQMTKM
jgi:hypothetical protein